MQYRTWLDHRDLLPLQGPLDHLLPQSHQSPRPFTTTPLATNEPFGSHRLPAPTISSTHASPSIDNQLLTSTEGHLQQGSFENTQQENGDGAEGCSSPQDGANGWFDIGWDLPPIVVDDVDSDHDNRLMGLLSRWPTKIPECLIPSYSGRHESPYRLDFELFSDSPLATMPLLYNVLAAFIVMLTAFAGIAQRFGDMTRAIVEVIIKLAITEDRKAMRASVLEAADLPEPQRRKVLELLDRPIETSASELQKNVKSVYKHLDINPTLIVNPKCPTKDCQATLFQITNSEGLVDLPDKCHECNTPLKEAGKVMAQFFPRQSLQSALEHLFSINGVERLVEQQQILREQQDERDRQLGCPGYMREARPGKIYRHQLDGECYRQDGLQRERGCLVLTINISLDYADPSRSRNRSPRSMGPILCQLADLPNQYRSRLSFMMIMGITPAPNEPPGCLLHRLLLALGVDLLSGECDGLWIRTPGHPTGEWFRQL